SGAPVAEIKDAEYVACPAPVAQPKTLVLITTDTLGRGDDTLGQALMGNFLATLPELGAQLWRIVLLNGGVKLASTEGKALDSLKALDAAGVSILVCGTCLQHYNLLDRKQVGETTNMLDIVTSLSLADKVIRP
ncbi:MAG: sulfurtransferase-like selenium metabolism protein YedF, partial [Desulfovibrio sp.]|nr:sulfurtransferase-like selenium metabolism protein YedF [Desulfovibrio sp.]